MSEESFRQYVTNRIKNTVKAYDPTFKMSYPNLAFDVPENEHYGRIYMLGGKSFNAAKDGEKLRVRRTGIVQITIFSPAESGTKRATELIDAIMKGLENHQGRTSSGSVVTFKAAETRYPDGQGGWHQTILRVPYYRDDLQSVSSAI